MAWTAPTVAEFKARFPAFQAVSDTVVQGALDEGALRADETWVSEADYRLGIMLYAAHVLTLDGHGTGAEAEAGAAGTLSLTSFKSGTFSFTKSSGASSGGSANAFGTLGMTTYGQRYLELLRQNVPAVAIAVVM